ncbi:hypothetical protein GQR58_023212 [Nymphon striatum]|nr:hypothetical protein GQR58_023212 [Nymphon striatum]
MRRPSSRSGSRMADDMMILKRKEKIEDSKQINTQNIENCEGSFYQRVLDVQIAFIVCTDSKFVSVHYLALQALNNTTHGPTCSTPPPGPSPHDCLFIVLCDMFKLHFFFGPTCSTPPPGPSPHDCLFIVLYISSTSYDITPCSDHNPITANEHKKQKKSLDVITINNSKRVKNFILTKLEDEDFKQISEMIYKTSPIAIQLHIFSPARTSIISFKTLSSLLIASFAHMMKEIVDGTVADSDHKVICHVPGFASISVLQQYHNMTHVHYPVVLLQLVSFVNQGLLIVTIDSCAGRKHLLHLREGLSTSHAPRASSTIKVRSENKKRHQHKKLASCQQDNKERSLRSTVRAIEKIEADHLEHHADTTFFPNIRELLSILAVLPLGSCEAERLITKYDNENKYYTEIESSLSRRKFSALLMCSFRKKPCKERFELNPGLNNMKMNILIRFLDLTLIVEEFGEHVMWIDPLSDVTKCISCNRRTVLRECKVDNCSILVNNEAVSNVLEEHVMWIDPLSDVSSQRETRPLLHGPLQNICLHLNNASPPKVHKLQNVRCGSITSFPQQPFPSLP